MKTHLANKDDLMHRCPHQACDYKTLQKSNLTTHLRTHTGVKDLECPHGGCDFATSDPGSLTRHRKRTHHYQPKQRAEEQVALPHWPFICFSPATTSSELVDPTVYSPTSSSSDCSSFLDAVSPVSSASCTASHGSVSPISSSSSPIIRYSFPRDKNLFNPPSSSTTTDGYSTAFEPHYLPFPELSTMPAYGSIFDESSLYPLLPNFISQETSHVPRTSLNAIPSSSFNLDAFSLNDVNHFASTGSWTPNSECSWNLENANALAMGSSGTASPASSMDSFDGVPFESFDEEAFNNFVAGCYC